LGDITLRGSSDFSGGGSSPSFPGPGTLGAWFSNVLPYPSNASLATTVGENRPWLRLTEQHKPRTISKGSTASATVASTDLSGGGAGNLGSVYGAEIGFMPPSLSATSFGGNINIAGSLTLAPSPSGTVDLMAAGTIDGLHQTLMPSTLGPGYTYASINLSDADPDLIPGIRSPMELRYST